MPRVHRSTAHRPAPTPKPRTQRLGGASTLAEGSRGNAVAALQRDLAALGLDPGAADGVFGPLTRQAVMAFQLRHNLAVDGVVGPQTKAALDAADGFSGAAPAPAGGKGGTTRSTGGGAPVSQPGSVDGSLASRVLQQAASHVGFHEVGNNGNPFSHYFGRPNEAWCADFVSYCFEQAGHPLGKKGVGFASVANMASWFQSQGKWGHTPHPGAVICFNWPNEAGAYNHTGIVERVANGYVYTIEGNSSDGVRRRAYPIGSSVISGYGYP